LSSSVQANIFLLGSSEASSKPTYDAATPSDDIVDLKDLEEVTEMLHKPVKLPVYLTQAISHNPDFFGQEDILRQMDEVLLAQPTSGSKERLSFKRQELKAFALCGMGGIGKTELAIQYVFTRQNKFDAIFWIYADTVRKLATAFNEIAQELGLASKGNSNEVAAREALKEWLSNQLGSWKRMLLATTLSKQSGYSFLTTQMIRICFMTGGQPQVSDQFW
jgi:hypothetical protein